MSENCDVIVFFPIYGHFAALRKPNSDAWSIKLTFSLIVTFYLTEPEIRTKFSNTALILSRCVKVLLLPKNPNFLREKC